MKKLLLFIFLFFYTLSIIFSSKIAAYTKEALLICFNTVIPSLFFLFFLTYLLVNLNLLSVLNLNFLKRAFKLNSTGAQTVVLGNISGLPWGAIHCANLYKENKIDTKTANSLLAFCVNASPSFIVSAVGASVFNNINIGFLIYLIQLISSFICGLIFTKKNISDYKNNALSNLVTFEKAFCDSVSSALKSILSVCAYMTVFYVISSLLLSSVPFPIEIKVLLSGFLEVVSGSVNLKLLDNIFYKFIFANVILNFASLSVLFQSAAYIKKAGLSLKYYISGKLFQSLISLILSVIFYPLIKIAVNVGNFISLPVINTPVYFIYAPIIILISAFLILYLKKTLKTKKNNI